MSKRVVSLAAGLVFAFSFMPALASAQTNWTGPYAGVEGGAVFSMGSVANAAPRASSSGLINYFGVIPTSPGAIASGASQSPTGTGGTVGGVVGYLRQFGPLVGGIETDFSYFGYTASSNGTGSYSLFLGQQQFFVSQKIQTDWLWTVRPRIGFAVDDWLFSASGGIAVSNVKYSFTFNDPLSVASAYGAQTNIGWTIGAAVEKALGPHWSAKGEFLYVDLGTVSAGTQLNGSGLLSGVTLANTFAATASLRTGVVRAGLSYRF
jgi:outer membrane immunogenic protein